MTISRYILPYLLLSFLLLILHTGKLAAQQGIQLSASPRISASQWQQPANLATDPFEKFTLGIGGAYAFGGNSLPISNWPLNDNFLDETEKENILAELADDNRFNILGQADLLFAVKIKKRPYSFGFRQRSLAYASFNNPNTLGVVLKGNAAYTGQRVDDSEVLLSIQSYAEVSASTAAQVGNLSYGGRIKFLFGNNYQALDLQNFSLFTSEFGTQVDVAADFEYDNSKGNPEGFGTAVDLGASYSINEALQINASVLDLGFISWKVDKIQNKLNTSYEGVFIQNINDLNFDGESNIFSSDSLQKLFFPDTSEVNSTVYLPAYAQVGITYKLSERSSLGALFRYGFSPNSPMSNKPQFSLLYQHHINTWLKAGVHGVLGGLEGLEAGAFLAGNISLKKKQSIQLFWQADQILGLISPQFGKGQAMQAGIIFKK